ncbi:MAG: hypothetical protein U1E50_08920 [Caulobacteraceae bacterium]
MAAAPPRVTPPPMSAMPAVGLSDTLVQQASAYRAYMARASAISPAFTDGGAVATAVRTGASYEPQTFLRGAVANAAIAALQDRDFVNAVRAQGRDAASRRALANNIIANPAFVFSFPGANNAAALAAGALKSDGLRLYMAGKAVKQSAYDVQRQAWSKASVDNRDGRLAAAKTLSATPASPMPDETNLLRGVITGVTAMGVSPDPVARAPYAGLVARAVSLAALAAIGEAGDVNIGIVASTLNDGDSGYCLSMAKLNLYQCLAVAKPHYEDIFCLGQHIMLDTGACLIRGAGAAPPIEVRPPPLPVPPPRAPRGRPARR